MKKYCVALIGFVLLNAQQPDYPEVILLYYPECDLVEDKSIPSNLYDEWDPVLEVGYDLVMAILEKDIEGFLAVLPDSVYVYIGADQSATKDELRKAFARWKANPQEVQKPTFEFDFEYWIPYKAWDSINENRYRRENGWPIVTSVRDNLIESTKVFISMECIDRKYWYKYPRVGLNITRSLAKTSPHKTESLGEGIEPIGLEKINGEWKVTSLFWGP